MPSEVLKQVAAMFDRLINIKTGNGRAEPVAMSSVRVSTTAGR